MCMAPQKTLNSQGIIEKEEQSWMLPCPNFKLYYKTIVTKAVWHWHSKQTHRPTEQNQESRNQPVYIPSTNILQGSQE